MLKSKKLFVSLMVLALFTISANATVSRLEGLGGSADPFWWGLPGNVFVLHDAATPGIWPQLVQQYPNLAGGEFAYDGFNGWDLQKVYATYSWSEKKTALQFALDRPSSYRFFNTAFGTNPGAPSRLNATFGTKFGDNLLFGVGLNYWGQSYKDTVDEASTSLIGLRLGLSGTGDNEWDLAAGIELPGFKNTSSGTTVSENNGSIGFNVAGRFWYDYSEKASLIPNIRFNMYKDAAKAGSDEDNLTNTQIAIGVGHNWWPVENTLVLFDVGVKLQTFKDEIIAGGTTANYDSTSNVLPYWRIGFETTVFSWLDGRIGADRDWVMGSIDDNGLNPEWSTATTNTFVGATAHWNRMVLDLVIHPDFFGNGPYFISGSGSPMFTRVSLKYDFNQ